jgi:hypothetical protein
MIQNQMVTIKLWMTNNATSETLMKGFRFTEIVADVEAAKTFSEVVAIHVTQPSITGSGVVTLSTWERDEN